MSEPSTDVPVHRLARLAELASGQAGLVTRRQALDAGFAEHHLRYRIEQGLLVVVHPGLLRFTAAPVDRRQALMGSLLLAGPGAALSHRTAAILLGTEEISGDVVDVLLPAARRRRPPGVIVHRTRLLPASHLEVDADGLLRTDAARTVVDLAEVQPITRVSRILEEWLADRKVTVAGVRRVLADLGTRGRAGATAIRDLLDRRVLGAEPGDSTDDALLGQLMLDRGLPVPIHNHLVFVDGEPLELDWAYPDEELGVEVNGFSVHTRSRRNYEHELRKRRLVTGTPWLVLDYSAEMVRNEPDRVVREVDAKRRSRAATRGRSRRMDAG